MTRPRTGLHEWVQLFSSEYRRLRPNISQRYALTHSLTAWDSMRNREPEIAAHQWLREFKKAG